MDEFAQRSAGDRADLFRAVATQRGLNAAIVEKDFWVCWTLKRLFALDAPPAGLLFKGGTSLAKVFKVIERFSEDIDLSFNRADLGFGGTDDPKAASTGKQRQKRLDSLTDACRQIIRDALLPRLQSAFGTALAKAAGQAWALDFAGDDPDQQTLVFQYPSSVAAASAGPAYIRPMVRLEIGARSDHWPAVEGIVTPYAAEDFPRIFLTPTCSVHVLAAERTFWEKATILHVWHHAPADKVLRDRQSRHYYDLVRMYEHGVGREAMKNTDLLLKVAEHKSIFFASAAAKYAEARPGTLRLVPPDSRLGELRRDYQSMQEMIFGPAPTFEHVMSVLGEIESAINAA
ncbi:MAG: nucleotidyl transferase AbiEii/AbiGii toxin family protein [Planctomycetota bacterium]|nr:nucleotidyl transferase AbiEii/AbiGii toxin family protein [Planctomycetota bacterium]